MSSRKILQLLIQPSSKLGYGRAAQERSWMGRPMYFQTASRLFKEERNKPVRGGGGGLGMPSTNSGATATATAPGGKKPSKGLAKTNWSRPTQKKSTTATTVDGKRVAPKRDWSKPVDLHSEKHAGETHKMHERHVNKFSKPPLKKAETLAQKRERKKREEELAAMAKEEEKERQQIALRKAKQKAKEKEEQMNQMKDVYIPEIINVANLSKVLGIRIGEHLTTMDELEMGNTSHDRMLNADESSLIAMQLDMNPVVDSRQSIDLFPRQVTEADEKEIVQTNRHK
ncbi:hypothetical protein MAM1_0024d02030 [Mucor ambiguus]|uniref:Uncharacterized protein n=1 Tax=Mucor ambiguus TaxID=91626 RepID=A0A0C9M1Y8_9FUNG|nr:hypothetical protein MAM1_0024d02030 [Mucor ambiguus]